MKKGTKRKQPLNSSSSSSITKSLKRSKTIGIGNTEPYPDHPRPTPDECLAVRDALLALHGFPKEFLKYREQRLKKENPSFEKNSLKPEPPEKLHVEEKSDSSGKSEGEESVLDGLVSTILSQNTTDVNSQRAFLSLKSAFPTWEDVLAAEPNHIEDAIRCGGLAPTKASCIKSILNCLFEKRGKLCLEYLRDLSIGEVKAELSQFKGIGPKTVACVLMFHLQQNDFPVDTHVFQIAKSIGWLPVLADVKRAYLHLNCRIPNNLKFDLNCLLFTHGKVCRQCSRKGDYRLKKESKDESCPLLT
ncbi:putative DNA glycosylase At3g47830 isoform X1 [Coffea eugenioides]|uniref:DNA glycosylase At3g47830 isoform X2 n=1 Tax=Coffea arabica TaxID=13443 RepID=A0A6P6X7Q8_COFAR|nr:putative DNA glycosylase At3g47830 isoform X1 [Coffea arabica]XP_027167456.1 putative DNA glycosylase At3g47830 isoform X1 [Coffea eugenioides]